MSAHSSLAEWHEEAYGPDYFTFTNVQLKGESLLFFKEEGKHWPESTSVPGMIPLNKDEAVIPLSVQQVEIIPRAALMPKPKPIYLPVCHTSLHSSM